MESEAHNVVKKTFRLINKLAFGFFTLRSRREWEQGAASPRGSDRIADEI